MPKQDQEIIELLKQNVRRRMGELLITFQTNSLPEMVYVCRNIEKYLNSHEPQRGRNAFIPPPRRNVVSELRSFSAEKGHGTFHLLELQKGRAFVFRVLRSAAKSFLLQMRPRRYHHPTMPQMFGKRPEEQFSVQGKLLPESEPGCLVEGARGNPSPHIYHRQDNSLDISQVRNTSPIQVLKSVVGLEPLDAKPIVDNPKAKPKTLH